MRGDYPMSRGAYVLILRIDRDTSVRVGALGTVELKKGYYAYVGSARGGLKRRLKRYIKTPVNKKHWHIDYLINDFEIEEIVCVAGGEEEAISALFSMHFDGIEGFGSSDVSSRAHLFFVANLE